LSGVEGGAVGQLEDGLFILRRQMDRFPEDDVTRLIAIWGLGELLWWCVSGKEKPAFFES
jgi:hypothetical protein